MHHKVLGGDDGEQRAHHCQLHSIAACLAAAARQHHHLRQSSSSAELFGSCLPLLQLPYLAGAKCYVQLPDRTCKECISQSRQLHESGLPNSWVQTCTTNPDTVHCVTCNLCHGCPVVQSSGWRALSLQVGVRNLRCASSSV